jgi:membrane protease YdiL (CAAX protease family)
MFVFVRQIALQFLYLLLGFVLPILPEAVAGILAAPNEEGFLQVNINVSTAFSALAFVAGAAAILKQAKEMILWAKEDMRLTHLREEPPRSYFLLFMATVGAVVGTNLLFELLDIKIRSASYQAIEKYQNMALFGIGLVCYGIVAPIAEELLFRGIVFNSMKRFMSLKFAVVLSAFCFGAYHMNSVQGAYGFIIGCLIAYGYVYFGNFYVPVVIHMVANLIAYSISNTGVAVSSLINWPVCVSFLVLGAGSILLLMKEKRAL